MIKQTESPGDIGLSEAGVGRAYGIVRDAVARGDLIGAALQISRGGVALAPACFGRRQVAEDGVAVTTDTIFLVASVTKPIVAAAAMLLVERGKFCLDDRVADLVPTFGQAGKGEVRVRHLLTHTSGLPDQLEENLTLRAQKAPLSAFVERICEIPLLFAPGCRISYQSCGIAMLGEIVERMEEMPLRDFLRQEFFDPLGLADTSLGVQTDRLDRTSEVKIPGGGFEYGGRDAAEWNWNSMYWRSFGAPWGGMLTTVGEMTVLCNVFLNGGRVRDVRVLSPTTVGEMTSDQTSGMPGISDKDRLAQRWGLGWRLRDRCSSALGDLTSASTFGHGGATGTVVWIDPETEMTFVLFTNDPTGAAPLRPRVANAVCGSLIEG